mgnify:FL=1
MVVEALVPPDAARATIVCTNAPNWYRELIFADLCTFLCPRSSNMMMAKSIAVPIDDGAIFQVKSISEIIY